RGRGVVASSDGICGDRWDVCRELYCHLFDPGLFLRSRKTQRAEDRGSTRSWTPAGRRPATLTLANQDLHTIEPTQQSVSELCPNSYGGVRRWPELQATGIRYAGGFSILRDRNH